MEQHVDQIGGTFTISVSFNEGCESSTVEFTTTSFGWIHINGNSITIDENSTTSARTGTVEVYMTPSGGQRRQCDQHTITFAQDGKQEPTCNCDNFNFTFVDAIPQTGLTVGEEMISYTIAEAGCTDESLTGSYQIDGGTVHQLVKGGNNKMVLNEAIPANDDGAYRTITISAFYDNESCSGTTKQQPGTGCSCSSVIENVVFSIPAEGVVAGSSIGEYEEKSGTQCSIDDKKITGELSNNGTSYEFHNEGDNFILDSGFEIPGNSGSSEITFDVRLYYDNNIECLDMATTTTQDPLPVSCNCNMLTSIDPIEEIPNEGLNVGDIIGYYTASTDSCNFTFIETSNTFTMVGTDGDIKLTSAIPRNTEDDVKEYFFKVKYGEDVCQEFSIYQPGTFQCTCNNVEMMITLQKITFSYDATDEILIASGNTHGCGELSGRTINSSMLHVYGDGNGIKTVYEGNDIYKFYVKIEENETGLDRSVALDFYFKKKNESEFTDDCKSVAYIHQTLSYCDCDNFPEIEYGQDGTLPPSSVKTNNFLRFESTAMKFHCHTFRVVEKPDWLVETSITSGNAATYYYYQLNVQPQANPNAEEREGVIVLEKIIDGGISCGTVEKEIRQRGTGCSSCDDIVFDNFGYLSSAATIALSACESKRKVGNGYSLNCGVLEYRFAQGKPNWFNDVIIENGDVTLKFNENDGDERTTNIIFDVRLSSELVCENIFNLTVRQEEGVDFSDCEAVKSIIVTYSGNCTGDTMNRPIAALKDKYAICGYRISGETNDSNVLEITESQSPLTSEHYLMAKLKANDTGSNRNITFNVFLIDEDDNIVPNQNCKKEVTICQSAATCVCANARLEVTDIQSAITAGSSTCTVAKVALKSTHPSYPEDYYPMDCLEISASSTETILQGITIDLNGNLIVTPPSSIDRETTVNVDINVKLNNDQCSEGDLSKTITLTIRQQ